VKQLSGNPHWGRLLALHTLDNEMVSYTQQDVHTNLVVTTTYLAKPIRAGPAQVKQLSDASLWGKLLALCENIGLGEDFLPMTILRYKFGGCAAYFHVSINLGPT